MKHAVALLPLLAAAAFGQNAPGPYDPAVEAIRERCERLDQKDPAADVRVWTGVVANRADHSVTVMGCATGIKTDDPLEFYVAPIDSGKDYESLAVTPAKPSDVAEALRFIGLRPGRPMDANKDRFWARGPRLSVSYVVRDKTFPAGDAVRDVNTGKAVPGELLFAGSFAVTDAKGEKRLAADTVDARPIAPDYEDPAAVLAVPRRAPQGAVYGSQKRTAAAEWKQGESVDVVLTPMNDGAADETRSLAVRLLETGGFGLEVDAGGHASSVAAKSLIELTNAVQTLTTSNQDLFTTVRPDAGVRVADVRKTYAVLQAVEQDHGVKLDAPGEGELYARAFFPDPAWRDRATRLGEPWELFLDRDGRGLTGKLERLADDPSAPPGTPPVLSSQAVADPVAFVAAVDAKPSKWTHTVFVYPPADLTQGELMAWVRPVLATYPRVFVFPAETPTTRP